MIEQVTNKTTNTKMNERSIKRSEVVMKKPVQARNEGERTWTIELDDLR
jgi:hypothetical protein